ncbi:MAG: UvrD-helicase domain-containing protein, partial [Gemmatimonadetes bacterium]|nr:UvrD-helicase domain-containing protein [Gemmatimonadota bacterium]
MRPADAETRERIVEGIGTTFVVEAGAGTGKTTLLVDRVTELLARGVPVTRLAVITFTRKAAAELVSRLGERLAVRRDDGEAWADRALADLDLADIGTTDAFCQRILAAFPLPADVPPGFAIADEIAEVALREEAWSRFLDDLGPEGAAWLERLRTLGASAIGLRGLADSLLEHRDLVPALEEVPENTPALVDVFAASLESLRSLLALCSDPGDRLFTHLRDLVNEGEMAITLGGSAGERLLLSRRTPGGFKTTKNVGRKDAWHGRKDSVISALTDLDQALNGAFEGRQAAEMHELVRRLRQYAAHYESLKRARGLLDFRDLAWRTRELLTRRPDVRQRVASRYDAILLDEVQDTDPLQMEIAFLLATNEPATDPLASPIVPGRLFLVGDPKQSI